MSADIPCTNIIINIDRVGNDSFVFFMSWDNMCKPDGHRTPPVSRGLGCSARSMVDVKECSHALYIL